MIVALSIIPWLPHTEAFAPVKTMFRMLASKLAPIVGAQPTEAEHAVADSIGLLYTTSVFISIALVMNCTTKRNRRNGRYVLSSWLAILVIAWILRIAAVL